MGVLTQPLLWGFLVLYCYSHLTPGLFHVVPSPPFPPQQLYSALPWKVCACSSIAAQLLGAAAQPLLRGYSVLTHRLPLLSSPEFLL